MFLGAVLAAGAAPLPIMAVDAVVAVLPADGQVEVTLTLEGVAEGPVTLRRAAGIETSALDVQGAASLETPDGVVLQPSGGPVTVRYRLRPGHLGRHGHQGWVADDWAAFDGRVVLRPEGIPSALTARVTLPEGWTAAAPAAPVGEVWSTRPAACFAAARAVRWPRPDLALLGAASPPIDATARAAAWIERRLPPVRRMVVVWLPDTAEGGRVHGGASADGTCLSVPTDPRRGPELVAHRLAHALTTDPPGRLQLVPHDRWFAEGFAGFVEVAATARDAPDAAARWQARAVRWRATLAARPEVAVALRDEPQTTGEVADSLHYQHAPLAVEALDRALRAHGGEGIVAFVAAHLDRDGPVELRTALEAWSGRALQAFFEDKVDQPP